MTELFEYKTCADAVKAARDYLLEQLKASDGNIVLLLSGGSSLNPVKEAFKLLDDETVGRIQLLQVDERYVDLSSSDSNWRQIKRALGSKFKRLASSAGMLTRGEDAEDIAITYEMEIRELLAGADETIGVYGVGADGHIAGMLPTKQPEEFTRFLDGRLVVDYQAHDFVRITTTGALVTKLNELIVFACGPQKTAAVERIDQRLQPHEHPAQMLKDAARVKLFIGEEGD
ncbi:MAG TPA: 6-phosphogluconolactonase [Candidatus Saccharimonadales bacterium]